VVPNSNTHRQALRRPGDSSAAPPPPDSAAVKKKRIRKSWRAAGVTQGRRPREFFSTPVRTPADPSMSKVGHGYHRLHLLLQIMTPRKLALRPGIKMTYHPGGHSFGVGGPTSQRQLPSCWISRAAGLYTPFHRYSVLTTGCWTARPPKPLPAPARASSRRLRAVTTRATVNGLLATIAGTKRNTSRAGTPRPSPKIERSSSRQLPVIPR